MVEEIRKRIVYILVKRAPAILYAIIDIETSGGSPKKEKITEIAILLHDGERVTQEFCTLVNPGKGIPHHITTITGITNEMVADAPHFYEVAADIVRLTEGRFEQLIELQE